MRTRPLRLRGSGPARRRRLALSLLGVASASSLTLAVLPTDPAWAPRWGYRAVIRARGGAFVSLPGVVLQSGLADCGPAALATLVVILGGAPPGLDSIGALAGTGPRGTTLGGLARAARALGVEGDLRTLDPGVLSGPVLAWVDGGHFVTVLPDGPGSFLVLDPQAGPYRIAGPRLRGFWSGEALVPRPARISADPAVHPSTQGGPR